MFFEKDLREDEEIIAVLAKSKLPFVGRFIISFVLFLVPFFFLFPLWEGGTWGRIGFITLLAVAIYYLLKLISIIHFNILIVTDQRVVDIRQTKFFERSVKEADLDEIKDVSWQTKGVKQQMARVGDLKIEAGLGEHKRRLLVKNIKQPARVQRLILDIIKHIHGEVEETVNTEESYEKTLLRIQNEIGRVALVELVEGLLEDKDDIIEEQAEFVFEDGGAVDE